MAAKLWVASDRIVELPALSEHPGRSTIKSHLARRDICDTNKTSLNKLIQMRFGNLRIVTQPAVAAATAAAFLFPLLLLLAVFASVSAAVSISSAIVSADVASAVSVVVSALSGGGRAGKGGEGRRTAAALQQNSEQDIIEENKI